jgi:hypothetical protein
MAADPEVSRWDRALAPAVGIPVACQHPFVIARTALGRPIVRKLFLSVVTSV